MRGCVSLKKWKAQGKAVEVTVNSKEENLKTFVRISSNSASDLLRLYWQSGALITRLDLIHLGNTDRNKGAFLVRICRGRYLGFRFICSIVLPLRVFCSSNKPTMMWRTHHAGKVHNHIHKYSTHRSSYNFSRGRLLPFCHLGELILFTHSPVDQQAGLSHCLHGCFSAATGLRQTAGAVALFLLF